MKAYIRPGGATWRPYAIYAGSPMVGFVALAFQPDTRDQYWLFHFFIDQRYQGLGHGSAALRSLVALVRRAHPTCEALQLVVHPDNHPAQILYLSAGFVSTGEERWGQPVYRLQLRGAG